MNRWYGPGLWNLGSLIVNVTQGTRAAQLKWLYRIKSRDFAHNSCITDIPHAALLRYVARCRLATY